jgi:fatty-acyl-CoA synthase
VTPADWIDRHAAFTPDRTALVHDGGALSYRELAAEVAHAAGLLHDRLGVRLGDRVAWLGHNAPEMLVLLLACSRLGAIFLPLNWRLAAPEHAWILGDCQAKVLFAGDGFADHAAGLAADQPALRLVGVGYDDARGYAALRAAAAPLAASPDAAGPGTPALLCYTSGTTGRPKGALLDQRALLFNALNSLHMHGLTAADRVLTTLPMFHVGGLNIQTLPALYAGATVVLHRQFDPHATLAALVGERITLAVLVPAQLVALLAQPGWTDADLGRLRCITTGSTLVPLALIDRVHAHGIPLIQVYGSTETAPLATYLVAADAARKAGSCGLPALHCEVRIVDDAGHDVAPGESGELWVRGPNVMGGYWNQPSTTAEALVDGWYRSGDVGHADTDGYLWIDDRKKEVIISGGENIYPAELENLLAEHPDLAEAAVVGRGDPKWGEVPVAVVVARAGHETDADGIRGWFDGKLARFKHPHDVIFRDALPRNAMGKVEKDAVRALVTELFAGSGD